MNRILFALLFAVVAFGQEAPKEAKVQETKPQERPAGVYATFHTSMGPIVCMLYDKEAPKTVANFIGLATGKKAWTNPKTG